jgi:hypothetical protein
MLEPARASNRRDSLSPERGYAMGTPGGPACIRKTGHATKAI